VAENDREFSCFQKLPHIMAEDGLLCIERGFSRRGFGAVQGFWYIGSRVIHDKEM
jgi:hypothetical protein